MLKDLDMKKYSHIYTAPGYTDIRQGIDGLSALIQYQFYQDPLGKDTSSCSTDAKGIGSKS